MRSARRVGVHGPGALRLRVARTIRDIADAPSVPLPGDLVALIPPTRAGFARRVPGTGLWLWYTATDDVVTLHLLRDAPPG